MVLPISSSGIGLGDIDQAALGLVQREALRLHLERELSDLQPGEGRALGAGAIGQGRAGRIGRLGQTAAGLVDVPLAVRFAGNATRPLGLVNGGVADAEATGGLAGGWGQLGHGGGPPAARKWSGSDNAPRALADAFEVRDCGWPVQRRGSADGLVCRLWEA
jgi:hypothetical protein